MFCGISSVAVDDDRRDQVRQDLPEHDALVGRAERPGGLDELLLAQRQHLPSDDAPDVRPSTKAIMKITTPRPGLTIPPSSRAGEQADAQADREQQDGNEQHVDDAREHRVDPAAENPATCPTRTPMTAAIRWR